MNTNTPSPKKGKPGPHAHQAEWDYFRHKAVMEQDCTLGAPYLAEIVQRAIDAAVTERTRVLREACEAALIVFRGWLHDVDPHNELGNDNAERAAAVTMIQRMTDALKPTEPTLPATLPWGNRYTKP